MAANIPSRKREGRISVRGNMPEIQGGGKKRMLVAMPPPPLATSQKRYSIVLSAESLRWGGSLMPFCKAHDGNLYVFALQ